MTASFSTSNGKTTLNFRYTADTAKLQEIIGNVAELLWVEVRDNEGIIINPFDSASWQDKADIVDLHIRKRLIKLSDDMAEKRIKDTASKPGFD